MAGTGKKRRTQILLEPEQHHTLVKIAKKEGRSVSGMVREIVQRYLEEQDDETTIRHRLAALERIRKHRAEMLVRRGGIPLSVDIVPLIHQMREDRDEQILSASVGEID